jgi:hypothetical protein
MKGLSILFDEQKKKRIAQIDLEEIRKDPEGLEDLLDVLIAESRRNEPTISLEAYLRGMKRRKKK